MKTVLFVGCVLWVIIGGMAAINNAIQTAAGNYTPELLDVLLTMSIIVAINYCFWGAVK